MKVKHIQNKVVKNAAWIIGARIAQAVLGMIISMLTARFLGPSNFGLINYAMSVVAFAAPIMQLGLTSIIVQEMVWNPEDEGEILGTSLGSCIVSAVISMVGIIAFVAVANPNEPITLWVCGLYSLTLLTQALEIGLYWFQAHLLSKYSSVISLIAYLLVAVYKIYLLATRKPVTWFAVSNAIDHFLIAIGLGIVYRYLGGQKLSFSYKTCKRLLHTGKYYILSGLMITVFAQTDRIMLKMMIGNEATGYYSAAVACAGIMSFVVQAIVDSARPSILEGKKQSEEAFERNMIRLYSVVIYFALVQSIGMTVFSRLIVHILYGAAYEASASALRIVVWYTTFAYLGAVRNIWILAEGKQHIIWKIDISGAVANVILNLMLIPLWGIKGAALASLLTQFITNVVVVGALKDVRPNIRLMAESLNPRILINLIKTK